MRGGYKNLKVWQKSMELARQVYLFTEKFPKEELYGLTSQMRRAAVSIPSNIAEGSKRNTKKDFKQFLAVALGSVAELETQVELVKTLSFGKNFDCVIVEQLMNEITKMLTVMVTND